MGNYYDIGFFFVYFLLMKLPSLCAMPNINCKGEKPMSSAACFGFPTVLKTTGRKRNSVGHGDLPLNSFINHGIVANVHGMV